MQSQLTVLAMLIAMLINGAALFQGKPELFTFDSQVGVVDASSEGKLCLNISNPDLSVGSPVSVILPHKAQRIARATIVQKLSTTCSYDPLTTIDASYYSLRLVGKAVALSEPMPPAIAVVGYAKPVVLRNGIASADLDNDGRKEFFRTCTSNEGYHLTVWSGKPLQGKRRWHSYYYLGYDVVSTCNKKDYQ